MYGTSEWVDFLQSNGVAQEKEGIELFPRL
jgi:hypothetical protein